MSDNLKTVVMAQSQCNGKEDELMSKDILRGTVEFRLKVAAIAWNFFIVGVLVGTFSGRIADIRIALGLSYYVLGLILITLVFGALAGLALGTISSKAYGSLTSTRFSLAISLVVSPVIGVEEGGVSALVIGLTGLGFGLGWLDVCNNSQAILIQRESGYSFMGLFQAIFSIGGFVGVIIGGAMSQIHISPLLNFIYISAALIPFSIIGSFYLYPKQDEDAYFAVDNVGTETALHPTNNLPEFGQTAVESVPKETDVVSNRVIYLAGIVGLVAYMAEGSVGDWGAIYLRDNYSAAPIISSLAFALFSLTLAGMRFGSDYLILRFSRINLLIVSGLVGFFGLSITVFSTYIPDSSIAVSMAILGFAIAGLGLGVPAPLILSMAGEARGMPTKDAIAILSSISYIGYMVGPPFLGGIAGAFGDLRWAFFVMACLVLIVVVIPAAGLIPNVDGRTNR